MALVYLAQDLRHDRPVALKLLRPELSAILGAERFLAEIRTTANLQHPHILPLHDSGEVDGLVYYVMPYVEGESLRDRLRREKHLPVDEAVRLTREVASALDYAHRRGIVHRDIKPENILLHDGQALVADFGIALAASRSDGGTRMTETGMSLGTPQYMAPEQAMGERELSPRADVYALGCVLYEMLVGEPPFLGPTPQAIIARLVTEQPRSITAQRPTVPVHVEAATLRALQKLPADRFATAAQFAEALANPSGMPGVSTSSITASVAAPGWRRMIPIATAVALTAAITSAVWWVMASEEEPAPVGRFVFNFPEGQSMATSVVPGLAVAADGSELIFPAGDRLYRRPMGAFDMQPIPGAESGGNINNPAYSPDGTSIAFYDTRDRALKRLPLSGGAPITVARPEPPAGISWDPSGIIYAERFGDIMRVPAEGGGTPEVLVKLREDEDALSPQMLPGGRYLLYTVATGQGTDRWDKARIVAHDLRSGTRTVLIEGGADARYLSSGHLVYAVGTSLFAVTFSARTLRITSLPVTVLEGVRRSASALMGTAHYAVSNSGTLVYVPGPTSGPSPRLDLALTDRQGNVQTLNLPRGAYEYPRVSPDGKYVAVGTDDGKDANIWIYDLAGTSAIRRLTTSGKDRYPIWSSDGRWVAFQSSREGDAGIFRQRADGSGEAERLTRADSGTSHVPESWSPVAEVFLFSVVKGGLEEASLYVYSLASRTATPFGDVRSVANHIASTFSPDGRWVAYTSAPATGAETFVFVQPYPPTGARYQLSQPGENGHLPMWSRDSRELFYVPQVGRFVARRITLRPSFSFGNPVPVPRTFPIAAPTAPRPFDITPDGRIIGVTEVATTASVAGRSPPSGAAVQINIVVNWIEELKQRVRPR